MCVLLGLCIDALLCGVDGVELVLVVNVNIRLFICRMLVCFCVGKCKYLCYCKSEKDFIYLRCN